MQAHKILLPVLALLVAACVPQVPETPGPKGGTAASTAEEGTEEVLKQAAQADSTGAALVRYGEWLLDRSRDRDVLEEIPATSPLYYLHFLRGVAAERLGLLDEARLAYGRYTAYSATTPAPPRFRIPGSRLQAEAGIRFEESGGG
ncbi:MAG TPA: hypothetical protein VLQ45_05125 [Thermoanaerobaculia bacterium]|nr:hypothetical protein [Thermoanaerobaculia bacterium]